MRATSGDEHRLASKMTPPISGTCQATLCLQWARRRCSAHRADDGRQGQQVGCRLHQVRHLGVLKPQRPEPAHAVLQARGGCQHSVVVAGRQLSCKCSSYEPDRLTSILQHLWLPLYRAEHTYCVNNTFTPGQSVERAARRAAGAACRRAAGAARCAAGVRYGARGRPGRG